MRFFIYTICLAMLAAPAQAMSIVEKEKINKLIGLLDVPKLRFNADGQEHNGAWAKKELEFRLQTAEPAISTAREFVDRIGSASPSDNRYTIKLPDGTLVDSGEWFTAQLQELEVIAATPPAPKDDDVAQ